MRRRKNYNDNNDSVMCWSQGDDDGYEQYEEDVQEKEKEN